MEILLPTLLKFCYTIIVVFILARFLYYPGKGQKEYLFTYILLAAIIAELCILISRVEMSFGFALGIFAIFSLIRYRTAPISPREMTYIFLSVGIAAKNHLAPLDMEFYKFMITDGIILVIAAVCEKYLFRDDFIIKTMVYDKIENIQPENNQELLDDLQRRFNITDVEKFEFVKIDAPKGSVTLKIKFKPSPNSNFDQITV